MKKILLFCLITLLSFGVLYGCVEDAEESVTDVSPTESEGAESVPVAESDGEIEESDTDDESGFSEVSEEISQEASEEVSLPAESSVPAEASKPEESSKPAEASKPEESSVPEEPSVPEESVPDEPSEPEVSEEVYTDAGDAEFIPSGYLLYDGAAYSQAYFSRKASQAYADAYVKYAETFPGVRITAINPPISSINIKNPYVQAMINDQGKVLDDIASVMYGDVNYINLRSTFEKHRGEYLFFKSDFHWTQLAAYYAYCEYAKSVGLTPTPLSAFEDRVLTTTFIGLTNHYANDERVNTFYDTLHAYMPRKEHTYTVYYDGGITLKGQYDTCVHTYIETYSCFLIGDQPYSVIEVPENDPEKVVMVIKESSGNAFVPFLMEHYGKIIVIDPRHTTPDIRPIVRSEGVDDIILFATASTVGNTTYCNYYLRLIGQ